MTGDVSQPSDSPIGDDSHPLAGAEAFGVGFPGGGHNLFDAALHLSSGGETGLVAGQTDFLFSAGGLLAVNHSWKRYQFTAQYSGAYNLYRPASFDDSGFQVLSVGQIVKWRRATLLIRDDFSQSSNSSFGSLSTGGPGLTQPTGLVTTVAPTFVPNETILTGQAESVNDFVLGEVDYLLSRRSTLTFAGSFGVLHFLTNGYVDSRSGDGRVGYGYQLDRKNTLGIFNDYNDTSFTGAGGSISTDTFQAAYGRRITGRTAFQLSAGPQVIISHVPGVSLPHQLSWSLYTSITHQIRRTTYSASYSRGVTNGSGVLLGSETDTVTASVSTVIWRLWTPSITGGYAFNASIATASTAVLPQYANWFGTVNMGRLWNRLIRTNFSYALQRQSQNAALCPVLNCGPTSLLQQFTVTVDWHIRPVGFE